MQHASVNDFSVDTTINLARTPDDLMMADEANDAEMAEAAGAMIDGDFFDHEPTKISKMEVRNFLMMNDGTGMMALCLGLSLLSSNSQDSLRGKRTMFT
jgi:hypothetical protein